MCQLLVVITVCYQWTKPAEWVKKAKREYEKETAIVDLEHDEKADKKSQIIPKEIRTT